jgi:hypothetical protein
MQLTLILTISKKDSFGRKSKSWRNGGPSVLSFEGIMLKNKIYVLFTVNPKTCQLTLVVLEIIVLLMQEVNKQ